MLCLCLLALLSLELAACPGKARAAEDRLSKSEVAFILRNHTARVVRCGDFRVKTPSLGNLKVVSTLDCHLQGKAEELLSLRKDKMAALVAVDGESGRVLAMVGMRRGNPDPSVTLSAFPAASLFKVVTAAAALDRAQMRPDSVLQFTGRRHTLHRSQINESPRRRAQLSTLAESFANSNNAIFGRLGIYRLGTANLAAWGGRLGFGKPLPFELPVQMSQIVRVDPEEKFQVAELASGYNRETVISPLQAAMMIVPFLNDGWYLEPYMVHRIEAAEDWVLYRGKTQRQRKVADRVTCLNMQRLMVGTVYEGTAKKAFYRMQADRVLSRLSLGGKTGYISSWDRKSHYQWFAGYGEDPVSGKSVAVAALVVHGQKRYSNPRILARKMLKEAFREPVVQPGG